MAKKSNTSKKTNTSTFMAFLRSNKTRLAFATILLSFTIFLLIAFSSFLFSGEIDQSTLNASSEQASTANKAGTVGARLSYFFITQGFGLSSFLFLFIFAIIIDQLFRTQIITKKWKCSVLTLLAILWISTTLGLIIPQSNNAFHVAGMAGISIASFMHASLGFFGSLTILFGLLIITLILAFDQFIPWVGRWKNRISNTNLPRFKQRQTDATVDEQELNEEDTPPIDEDDAPEKTIKLNNPKNNRRKPFDEDEDENDNDTSEIKIEEEPDEELKLELESEVEPESEQAMREIQLNNDAIGITIEKKEEEEFVASDSSVGDLNTEYDPTLDLSNYKFPTIDLLDDHQGTKHDVSDEELIENKNKIVEVLGHFKIEIEKIHATIGPTITLYEIVPAPGTRVNKVKNLEDDIALSLAALGVRIIAPMPGKGTIGIEVPNKKPEIVSMRSIVASKRFQESKAELPVVMGKTITNETFVFDLTKMPHLLVAGATGQGKSVGLNAIITSLLYKKHPSQLKMVMVDPKMVELNIYGVIEKHFLAQLPDAEKPIITEVDKVKNTLNSLTIEMDERYKLLMKANTRNIKEYNSKFIARRLNPNNGHKYLPYIVVVVDEFADLIMTAGKEIETPIARIAQKARAVGIHMIIATQRPSTNIITGVIKANFPGRIAFRVASMIDSRTILDTPGANQLIGKGDMLFMQGSDMTRLQCAFVDTPEVERVCDFIADQQGYPTPFMLPEYVPESDGEGLDVDLNQLDEYFNEVARMVVSNQMGSTSMIQRKFSIGYNRAGRIMDQLEASGVVGPAEGSKPRQVLIQDDYALEQLINNL
ncbi:MAG: DNA translocase FtsK 4TM domain-containing protein [Mangrovibacterium sp.]